MNRVFFSLVTVFLLLSSFMVFHATKEGSSPVLTPSELAEMSDLNDISRLRVAGRVAEAPVDYQLRPDIKLSFSIINAERDEVPGVQLASVPVVYRGLKPDMFSIGRDVIIDGQFVNGTVVATSLLTQCPSKYEAPHPAGEESSSDISYSYE